MTLPIQIIYEESDIPAEMTLREYRRTLRESRRTLLAERHEARARQGLRRFLAAFVR
ncbi:MAG: hypothetical protein ACJ76V_01905 [Thermoleophilaceae bacterium]